MKNFEIHQALHNAILDLETQISDRFGKNLAQSLPGMLSKRSPVAVVKMLCHRYPSGMFRMLASEGHLELTIEALAIREDFAAIIPAGTRAAAERRLEKYGALAAA